MVKFGGRRQRIRGTYVTRDKKGRFKTVTRIGRSIAADRQQKSKYHPRKSGYDHKGDYRKRVVKRRSLNTAMRYLFGG